MTTKVPKKKGEAKENASLAINDIAGITLRILKLLVDFGAVVLFFVRGIGSRAWTRLCC